MQNYPYAPPQPPELAMQQPQGAELPWQRQPAWQPPMTQDEYWPQQPMPWLTGSLAGWSIVGMNHYRMHGRKNLFVAMARQGVCIEAEGPDDAGLWGDLEAQAHKHEQAQQPQEPRKPLTEDQIYTMYSEPCSDAEMVEFAREVERHHGIGEADHG